MPPSHILDLLRYPPCHGATHEKDGNLRCRQGERLCAWSDMQPRVAESGLVVERVRENAGVFVRARRTNGTT